MALTDQVLSILGYDESEACLRSGDPRLSTAPQVGHVLRKAVEKLHLEATFVIHPRPSEIAESSVAPIPAVYVCSASSEIEAEQIHRQVWNQDVTPFVLIISPKGVRLVSGFQHRTNAKGEVEGLLSKNLQFDEISEHLGALSAQSLTSGDTWRRKSEEVRWRARLNRQLLDNLLKLDRVLQADGLDQKKSHSLIGKFVYLRYLRDRDILSDRKLARWGIAPEEVFGSTANVDAVAEVNQKLDEWLNGSVFPLSLARGSGIRKRDVQLVSGVFNGDQVYESGEIQLALDFASYDFSFIPIETLSLVYEQFLHAGRKSDARTKGAFYTPIPVVNLMLAELNETRPLSKGMKVIDPSCGSGAFLVQAYRMMIEREFPPGTKPKPGDLRDLLERSVHGIDVDEDACNVTELSLILTLLDYLDPPDLEDSRRKFKLPNLRNQNIFCANFFDPAPDPVREVIEKGGFDWVVGNPPWKNLSEKKLTKADRPVWDWIGKHEKRFPVGSNQAARAFVWKSAELLAPDSGQAALFLPAMTLYDNPSLGFRQRFFSEFDVSTVADFSNLAEVISGGRFRVPSAAFFFAKSSGAEERDEDQKITFYPPKVANQELTRPRGEGERTESWELVINGSEIREVSAAKAASGDGLVWKLAMWGSHLDEKLLNRLGKEFSSLGELEENHVLIAKQGPELKTKFFPEGSTYPTERCAEVENQNTFETDALRGLRNLFVFPRDSIVENLDNYIDLRAGKSKLEVCTPPHVIISAARNFSIYSEEYLIVPPRQIGIVSPAENRDFLKALSLFLSSDFLLYHQFFESSQFGIQRAVSTLKSLRKIPIPLDPESDLSDWAELHDAIVAEQRKSLGTQDDFFESKEYFTFDSSEFLSLLRQLNKKVFSALQLTKYEIGLVNDLVHIKLGLRDGKIEDQAVKCPSKPELLEYAKTLKRTLDEFLGQDSQSSYNVSVIPSSDGIGMVETCFSESLTSGKPASVESPSSKSDAALASIAESLKSTRAQWIYFNRNFRVYDGNRTLFFKPMQRFHWTRTQAVLDAQGMIVEILAAKND